MATALEDSYARVMGGPINASGGGRPGGDQIAISFSKGKKSTQEQLDELAILKAQDDLNRLSLIPVGSEQQRYEWEAENQRLAQEAAVRSATQAAIDIQQREQALKTSMIMDPLDVQARLVDTSAQLASMRAQETSMQAQELAMREKRLLLPGELAGQQASLASSQQALLTSQQAAAHAAKMNPLDIKSAEMQIAQSALTNPLDVKAKQVGIQGAQQQIQTAKLDEMYREQAYRDAHVGWTPAQMNTARASQSAYNIATNNAPIGSAAERAYRSTVVPASTNTSKPYWDQWGYNATGKPR